MLVDDETFYCNDVFARLRGVIFEILLLLSLQTKGEVLKNVRCVTFFPQKEYIFHTCATCALSIFSRNAR